MKWADISGKSKQRRIQSLGSAGRETAPSDDADTLRRITIREGGCGKTFKDLNALYYWLNPICGLNGFLCKACKALSKDGIL